MAILLIEINLRPEKKDLWLFSLLLVPFGAVIGYLMHHYGASPIACWITGSILSGLGLVGLAVPSAISWFFIGWMILAFPIGWTVSHLVLGLVFFGLFFPFGMIARCFGYDPLQMRGKQQESYWHELERVDDKKQYFRQF